MEKTLEAGSFFISSDSEKVVQNLKRDLDEAKYQSAFDDNFTYVFESLKAGLSEIQRLAKKGLRFSPKPLILLWRRLPDSNRRITALQAVALPLGQAAVFGAGNGI